MKKGFTLIELLIVIAILAILATTVVLVLNPAQILAQARDAQRISDLSSVKSAIALYLATASTPAVTGSATCTLAGCPGAAAGDGPFTTTEVVNTTTGVAGAGWVLVDLTGTSGGASLSALPLDPLNTGNYFYGYAGDATNMTFELAGRLESVKYRGMMTTDGGDTNTCPTTFVEVDCYYEIGTDSGLNL